MSPVSRGRTNGKKAPSGKGPTPARRPSPPTLSLIPDVQDQTPSSPDADETELRALTADILAMGGALREGDDPLMAEVAGATFALLDDLTDGSFEETFLQEMVPRLEAAATRDALAVLLAMGSVAPAAQAAADRLAAAGASRPQWADELTAPLVVGDFQRRYDDEGTAVLLSCTVERGGRSHAFLVRVDPMACGEAADLLILPADDLPRVLEEITEAAREDEVQLRTETPDAEEFRWQVENALNARAVHDGELLFEDEDDASSLFGFGEDDEIPLGEEGDEEGDEDGPPYKALALVLRSRLATLPTPRKPPLPHADSEEDEANDGLDPLGPMAGLAGLRGRPTVGHLPAASLPQKPRPEKRQQAPIYQIKVGLRGAKPPIWRRLEVPADTSLARLHTIVQKAFDWDDSHLHVFETPYGRFGAPDKDLGQRAERPVSLEQVLPGVRSRIGYTYDFGDDWDHEIVLESILDPDPSVRYPRCTGGRRAAPPEDCGGVWGYEALLEILRDPGHPEHDDRLEWLGLSDPADFDTTGFDAQRVTAALSQLR